MTVTVAAELLRIALAAAFRAPPIVLAVVAVSVADFDESIKKMKFDNLRALFSNCKSDSYGFVKILDHAHSYFINIGVVKKDVTINLITNDRIAQYQTLKNSYLSAKKTGDYMGFTFSRKELGQIRAHVFREGTMRTVSLEPVPDTSV